MSKEKIFDFRHIKGDMFGEKTRVLILRMDRVPHIDQSGVYALTDNISNERGIEHIIEELHEVRQAKVAYGM